jgi:hypothetical protein
VLGSIPFVVYGAMLAATVAGQFLGMAVDAVAIGRHVVWVPLAFSVVLEAVVGARFGAARVGHPLTVPERARLSLYYSACLLALSVPLAGWIAASKASPAELAGFGGTGPQLLVGIFVVLGVAAAWTAVRFGLMTLFTANLAQARRIAS